MATELPWLDLLGARFYDALLRTHAGRSFVFNLLLDGESGTEAAIFDALLEVVDDPQVRRVIRTHRDDERRHADRLVACLRRNGSGPAPIPPGLRRVGWIDEHMGGCFEAYRAGDAGPIRRFVAADYGVMKAYLLGLTLEERSVRVLRVIAAATRPYDRDSAMVIEGIARDEQRHVGYARAIGRRYAPSEAVYEQHLRRYQIAEARAFTEEGFAMMQYAVAERLVDASRVERLWWQASGLWGGLITNLTRLSSRR